MKGNEPHGYIFAPFRMKVVKTDINGETVWYANKWKNLLLKIVKKMKLKINMILNYERLFHQTLLI